MNSREKGANGERWLVRFFKERFTWANDIRREALAQASNASAAPDILLPGLWVESKYQDYKRTNPKKAYEQAYDACDKNNASKCTDILMVPVAICRSTNAPKGKRHDTATMSLEHFCVMYESLCLRAGLITEVSNGGKED